MVATRGSPFVGRERELEELGAALDEALCGRGRLVMLVGEPGIGKTRTAEEFATRATSRGAQVLWGRCHEEPGAPPFWPWLQVIRAYVRAQDAETLRSDMGAGAADIAELVSDVREKLPDLKPPPALESPDAARFRLFDSIAGFLANASKRQPLLLILDNLHWADKPSLLLLEFVARELGKTRVLVVGTYRDVEVSRRHPLLATLGELTRERLFHRVLLRGLDKGDVGRLVELTAGLKPPETLVEAVNAQTEGNPFFVTEVVRLLREEGVLTRQTPPDALGRRGRIPEGVREVVGQRLNRLSEQCNRVLTIAAVIGREFTLTQLERLSEGVSSEQLLDTLEEALSAHTIEDAPGSPDEYRFTHALVQHTLLEELSAARRVRLHARIAEALESLYGADAQAHAAELAYHFAEAEPVLGSVKLVKYSLLAGESALAAYAYEEAVAHFQRGLAAKEGQPVDGETANLLFGLGKAEAALLLMDEAAEHLTRAFDHYDRSGDVQRSVAVASVTFTGWRGTELMAPVRERVLQVAPTDSAEVARLMCAHARHLALNRGDYESARELCGKALTVARGHGDKLLELRVRTIWANAAGFCLRDQDWKEQGSQALELVESVDSPWDASLTHGHASLTLLAEGDLRGARVQAAAALAAAERLRDRERLSSACMMNQVLVQLIGDWAAARDFCDRAQASWPHDSRVLFMRTLMEWELGNQEQAEVYLERLLYLVDKPELGAPYPDAQVALAIPLMARISGDARRFGVARESARRVLASPRATLSRACAARMGIGLMAAMEQDAAAAREQWAVLQTMNWLVNWAYGVTPRVAPLIAQAAGEMDKAAARFGDILATCQKGGYRPELAWTCHDYAECLLQRNVPGDREKAAALVEEGLPIAVELGMRPLHARLAALREKLAPAARPAPAYPDGLTEREVAVLRLVAAGKSNREIAEELVITLNTVAHHVSNIFNKTGVSNRVEATAYAMRNGLA